MSLLWVNAAKKTWYHGTEHAFSPGDRLTSASERGDATNWDTPGSEDHVHITSDEDGAWYYAHAHSGHPRVYEVKHEGLHKDDWADDPVNERTTPGATVLSEVKHPDEPCHWCDQFDTHPDDWKDE